MRLEELLRFAGNFFEKKRIDYFVFGATAMNFWIPPRNTVDLDVVVCVDKRKGSNILNDLKKLKLPITTDFNRKFAEGRLIKIPLGDTEFDLKLGRTPHERQALARSKLFKAEDFSLRIAVPEDLVLFKLQSWRRQDQADIERMLKLRTDLDIPYIESWLGPVENETAFPMKKRWDEIRGT